MSNVKCQPREIVAKRISQGQKLKIIFLGTPEFSAIVLKGLCQSEYRPILVVTAPDKPVGRKQIITPPPVKLLAEKYKIPILQPHRINNSSYVYLLSKKKPDLIVVAAYGQILPKEILDIPKYGCLNVHPSLLPKYRGPSPIHYAILNGDEKTGATLMLMDEKMDRGPILVQQELEFPISGLQFTELHKKLAELGTKLLIETIPKWIKGGIEPNPQDHSKATYTKVLTRDDGKIDWKKTAKDIEQQVRAFEVWPESFTFWQKDNKFLRIKILKARIFKPTPGVGCVGYPVGKTLVVPQNEIGVQCGRGFLVIEKLQLEGKNEMLSEEFLRGLPDFIGTILK